MRAKLGASDLVELGRRGCGRGKTRRKGHIRVRKGKRIRVRPSCVAL